MNDAQIIIEAIAALSNLKTTKTDYTYLVQIIYGSTTTNYIAANALAALDAAHNKQDRHKAIIITNNVNIIELQVQYEAHFGTITNTKFRF